MVTYFTTDVRCDSCRKIESWTKETVETRFAKELEIGRVQFRIQNTDRPENAHFIKEYELVFKTVVISRNDPEGNVWQKMDKVWELLGDQNEFGNYLAKAIGEALAVQTDTESPAQS